ncbi:hypothetical protein H072_8004 [Dactylellina haptotyla CBS 200.50]|uniref:Uncharacterized protein n=1 Tax=Dactylellina haptotyla (strain CBS 200.50) TaxID=1284197 RepID=S8A658_DACHA|nr:hypothetical protein H072_8004 [Dactylellina haptotyla CBS 200.50]
MSSKHEAPKSRDVHGFKDVPTSGHWVAFITAPTTRISLAWSEWGGSIRRGIYYNCCAYWGMRLPNLQPGQLITRENEETLSTFREPKWISGNQLSVVLGETQLFIAAEYIDSEYRDGPLAAYHIKDLVRWNETQGPLWITMQLNNVFQYGQNNGIEKSGKVNRWIVYHPPISRMIEPPRIFQHHFTGTLKTDLVQAAVRDMHLAVETDGGTKLAAQVTGKILSQMLEIVRNGVGHWLHTFLETQGINSIIRVKIKDLEPRGLKETLHYKTVIQEIQYWEKDQAEIEEKEINRKMESEMKALDNYEKALQDIGKSRAAQQKSQSSLPRITGVKKEERSPSPQQDIVEFDKKIELVDTDLKTYGPNFQNKPKTPTNYKIRGTKAVLKNKFTSDMTDTQKRDLVKYNAGLDR